MNDNNHHHFKVDLDVYNQKKKLGDILDNILTDKLSSELTFKDIFYYGFDFAFEQFREVIEKCYKHDATIKQACLDLEEAFNKFERE